MDAEPVFDKGFRCWSVCAACCVLTLMTDGTISAYGMILEVTIAFF